MAARTAAEDDERTALLVHKGIPTSSSNLQIPAPAESAVDEEARLLGEPIAPLATAKPAAISTILQVVSVLLIGVFISNADTSLLMATHPVIASEFDALHDSSWLLTSFGLAAAATQPLYGKMSDIYGRKSLLMLAYTLFGAGCALMGVGRSMSQLLLGRVVSGLGASGMTALVSILITDLVPLRDVASWRSYVNIAATTGRSIGGPLGGWLADTVGWRWSFLGQAPLAGLAIILIGVTLPAHTNSLPDEEAKGSNLARIDFAGATFMTLTILCFLFPLEIGGDRLPWNHPLIFALLAAAFIFGAVFLLIEARFAKEPIIPISLLKNKDIVMSSLIMVWQGMAQIGLMIAIPLYFQITAKASSTIAGAHLFPAVAGNAIGGILSGIVIKRTGRYKTLTLLSILASSIGYTLLVIRWHGNTNWLESLYIIPGGFAMGVAGSTLFISIQAAVDPAHSAVATSTLYLAMSISAVVGMASSSAVLQGALRSGLDRRLIDAGYTTSKRWRIIECAASDVHYVDRASPKVARLAIGSYIEALMWTHVLSLASSVAAFVATLFLRQHKL